jgi:RNA polymerase primary sigma factor
LLTPEQERDLAHSAKKGDRAARDEMIRSNLKLVVSIAKMYRGRAKGMSFLDLIAEGNLGLFRAVERYDPERPKKIKDEISGEVIDTGTGHRFSTYATWWIKQAIRRAMVNTAKTIRIPSYMVEIIGRWKNVSMKLYHILGRQPTINEIARELDISPDSIGIIKRMIRTGDSPQAFSLELLHSFSEGLEDIAAKRPEESVFSKDESEKIKQLLGAIDEREALILRLRYGIGGKPARTLREIGQMIDLTRERVRQIENDALRKLQRLWLKLRKKRTPAGEAADENDISMTSLPPPMKPFGVNLSADGCADSMEKARVRVQKAINEAVAANRIEMRIICDGVANGLRDALCKMLRSDDNVTYVDVEPEGGPEGAAIAVYLRREEDEHRKAVFLAAEARRAKTKRTSKIRRKTAKKSRGRKSSPRKKSKKKK